MKLSEVVQELIRLGDASRAYWDRELPRYHPRYPLIGSGEKPAPPPPEDAEILALLKSLPENQLYAVMFLAYVGRGDFSADNFLGGYRNVKEMFPNKELVISQLTGNKALAEYLADAMEEIRERRIDLDSIQFASTVAVS